MSLIYDELAEAFREHRDAFGVSVIFGATTVTAVVEDSEFSRELVEGGFAEAGNVETRALKADFTTLPIIGSPATWNDRSFRIASITAHPTSPVLIFSLRPAKR
ncbi:MAG: hypothetical protein V4733_03710 [Verrucomicrobiota bacterium]